MKEDVKVEAMFSNIQTSVFGLKVLNKSFTNIYHVKKVFRNMLKRWRPKVTNIEEAKDMNNLTPEDLICSLQSHEIDLDEDEPQKKPKYISLKYNGRKIKALQFE